MWPTISVINGTGVSGPGWRVGGGVSGVVAFNHACGQPSNNHGAEAFV